MAKFASGSVAPVIGSPFAHVTVNHEGGLAFLHDARRTLVKMASCSLVREQGFYGDTTSGFVSLLRQVALSDPEWLVKLGVFLREELRLRSMPTLLAAVSAATPACRPYLKVAATRILSRPDDLLEFLALLKDPKHGLSHRLPRVAREVVAEGLRELDEYRVIKYRRGGSLGLRHALKLCHPVPANQAQRALFSYAVQPRRWESHAQEWAEVLPKVAAYERLKRAETCEALDILGQQTLPWEVVLPQLGTSKDVWAALAPQMPLMALLRNLRNLARSGALGEASVADAVVARLTDPAAVQGSKVLPFRWLAAHRELESEMNSLRLRGPRCRRPLRRVQEALAEGADVSAANLPVWPGKSVIACDLSGSMDQPRLSASSSLTPKDIACLLGAMAENLCEQSVTVAFGTIAKKVDAGKLSQRALQRAQQIGDTEVGGATFGETVLVELFNRRIRADRIVFLTDMEMYSPSAETVLLQWVDAYWRFMNPEARLVFINLQPYETFLAPQDEERVTTISGWSDGVLKYVAAAGQEADVVEAVSNLRLETEAKPPPRLSFGANPGFARRDRG